MSRDHSVHPIGLGSGGEEVGVELFDGFEHDAEGCDREDDHLVTEVVELTCGDERGFAELGHIGEEGNSGEASAELFEFGFGVETFREDSIGSCLDIGFGAVDGTFDAFYIAGVGSGDDEETWVRFVSDGGTDFGFHVGGGDHFFSVEVAASFGGDLVFKVDSGETSAFHFDDGSGDVPDIPKSGVGIADDWDGRDLAGAGGGFGEFARGDDGDVGEAGDVVGDGSAGEIDAGCALLICGEGSEGAECSGHDNDLVLPEIAEGFSG